MRHLAGFDHISATVLDTTDTTDTADTAGQLQPLSYNVKFVESNLPIRPEKEHYMREVCSRHSLALLTSAEGSAVELIRHHDGLDKMHAPYCAVTDAPVAGSSPNTNADQISEALTDALGREFTQAELACGLPYYAPVGGDAAKKGITMVALPSRDLATSTLFWTEGMGFSEISHGSGWCLLEFKAVFKTLGVRLLLTQAPDNACGIRHIDDFGWTSLAFFSKNIHKSSSFLKDAGARDIGTPYPFTVNGNDLKLLFFRGPDNELIELMEVQKRRV